LITVFALLFWKMCFSRAHVCYLPSDLANLWWYKSCPVAWDIMEKYWWWVCVLYWTCWLSTANTPPSVTGPTRIDARISQAVTASYTYSDADGDSVSLVVTSSPPGANVVESPGTWTITWTPVDFNPVSLSYVVWLSWLP